MPTTARSSIGKRISTPSAAIFVPPMPKNDAPGTLFAETADDGRTVVLAGFFSGDDEDAVHRYFSAWP